MSDTDLDVADNTSDEDVGRVLSLGIEEAIAAGDDDPSDTEIIVRSTTTEAVVKHPVSIAVTATVSKGYPPMYWTSDMNWSPNYNWHKPLNPPEIQALDSEWGIHIYDKVAKSISIPKSESLPSITDSYKLNVKINRSEAIKQTETFSKVQTMWRDFEDSFSITSSVKKTISIKKTEKISIFDTMRRAAQGVLSDVIFEDGSWTAESIKNASRNGRHAGFGEWETFIFGSHTYSSAIFRTAIDLSSYDLGLLTNFEILIDVQDVNDRGAVSITNTVTETFVPFTKTFLVEPEVVASMRTGTTSSTVTPVLGQVTLDGFYVKVIDIKTDAQTTGMISWIAHGY